MKLSAIVGLVLVLSVIGTAAAGGPIDRSHLKFEAVEAVTVTHRPSIEQPTPRLPSDPKTRGSIYAVTTNVTDPSCDTGFEGYVNLQGFGITPQAAITGNNIAFVSFSSGDPIRFYGGDHVGMRFTDDGFTYFDSTPGATPGVNTALPTAGDPSDLVALLWNDMEIVYDATNNHGISLATAGTNVIIIEYDDPQPAGGGASIGDFELIMTRAVDNTPGAYELVLAYANIGTLPANVTVGLEDGLALDGEQFLFGSPAGVITDGLIVCFDAITDTPVELTAIDVE